VLDRLDKLDAGHPEFEKLLADFIRAAREHIDYEENQVWPGVMARWRLFERGMFPYLVVVQTLPIVGEFGVDLVEGVTGKRITGNLVTLPHRGGAELVAFLGRKTGISPRRAVDLWAFGGG
jgi:hypothetical protein